MPVLGQTHSKKKEVLFMFRGNLLFFSVCLLPLVLSLGTTVKSLSLSFLHPGSTGISTHLRDPSKLSLLQGEESQLFDFVYP